MEVFYTRGLGPIFLARVLTHVKYQKYLHLGTADVQNQHTPTSSALATVALYDSLYVWPWH